MMRRYQSSMSRFAQPDPYDGSYNLTDPQSLNRYAYTQNDPVNFIDPSGLRFTPGTDWANGCTLAGYYDDRPVYFCWNNSGPQSGWIPGGGEEFPGTEVSHTPSTSQHDPACTRVNALFDASGQGYYTYGPQSQRYGQPGMVAALQNFASDWNQNHPNNPIGVGDLSQFGGAPNWSRHPGGGHAGGVVVDIRPMRSDNVNGPTNIRDSAYSSSLTNLLVQGLLALPEVVSVRFNDPNIQGTLRDSKGHVHNNHLHVTFQNAIGCP
jgi:hypothetical protein